MKVVCDTSTLVSSIFWRGNPREIVKLAGRGKIKLILSEPIIEELVGVVLREKFFKEIQTKRINILEAIKKIIEMSTIVEPTIRLNVVDEDPEDNKIIECAVTGDADFIVSSDNHLLKLKSYKGIPIITQKDLLNKIEG